MSPDAARRRAFRLLLVGMGLAVGEFVFTVAVLYWVVNK
jgi:hypothetical protein